MAQVVTGVAASHTPQLSSGVELWEDHAARDRKKNRLLGRDGEYHTYDELLGLAPEGVTEHLGYAVWERKYKRAQECLGILADTLVRARPDMAVVIGDDQWEMFQHEGVPTFALCTGDELFDDPKPADVFARLPKGLQAAQWAAHGDRRAFHKIHADLSRHLLKTLAEADFDLTGFSEQRQDRTLGHAFTFPRYRLGLAPALPIVPVFINTYYPPNVPSSARCLALGRALGKAIESWDSDARVAVITSGGLSHFVVNEELDRKVLDALRTGDLEPLAGIGRCHLRDGNSEILNWITAAGAMDGLRAEVVDYLPGYRSPAGTGTGMAFARWPVVS